MVAAAVQAQQQQPSSSPPSGPPILGLRMRSRRSNSRSRGTVCSPPLSPRSAAGDDSDRVRTMLMQDRSNTYGCVDKYTQRLINSNSSSTDSVKSTVDTVCREKMVEWMYRVADHFNEDREIVAMGQSALDRFVSKCPCDRSAFKLAAMTALYVCSKTNGVWGTGRTSSTSSHHHHQYFYDPPRPAISIQSLAELSRGEFDAQHISEMEMIILQSLGWRMNPPTVQSFIHSFYHYLPTLLANKQQPQGQEQQHSSNMIASSIYQRAIFFAELAVYDHAFVTTERALLAVSAFLNAMEGIDEASVPAHQQDYFLHVLESVFKLSYPRDVIEDCRNRLWFVYSMTAQYRDEEDTSSGSGSSSVSTSSSSSLATKGYHDENVHCADQQLYSPSPTCVKQHKPAAAAVGHQSGHLSSSPVCVVVSPMQQQ
eukprot:CAMPEP_0113490796 /NCGR_PEP_ID=MMETSP0014_2-20120614/27229_1 /TAXON_ID=2857 /ORGANISM="Nitzschia sp." /LENGTH=425 /DNA_ID=CAMNT_0000384575 /DNA_START=31 /DNA_END=1308 /DNA_ORIENTATION=- /assembly_acc=CAM_ASM_000159